MRTELFALKARAACWTSGCDSGDVGPWVGFATGFQGCCFLFHSWSWNKFLWLRLQGGITCHKESRAGNITVLSCQLCFPWYHTENKREKLHSWREIKSDKKKKNVVKGLHSLSLSGKTPLLFVYSYMKVQKFGSRLRQTITKQNFGLKFDVSNFHSCDHTDPVWT